MQTIMYTENVVFQVFQAFLSKNCKQFEISPISHVMPYGCIFTKQIHFILHYLILITFAKSKIGHEKLEILSL